MAIQGFFTGDVKIRDLNGVLKAVDGIVEVATDAGTVTSVGLTVGSSGTDVNVANSPITTSGSITLNLPTASATNRGLLSSADWTTFNSKQGTITLTTTGSSGAATLIGTTLNIPNYGSALSGYVPYTGATGNVDLGEFELKAGQLTLDVSPTGTAAVGTTRWNNTIGSSETTLKGGSVILKNGVDLVARVVNKVTPNTTLTKANYPAVRVSGAQGQRLAVAYAQANNDSNSADTIGLVTETIATNQEGFIMTVGQLEGINTTGSLQGETWADGDVLYLSPTTPGALTNIKPTGATGHIVVMGYVEYAHANNGAIYVKVMNGWELDELHNVYISSVANNQGLFYESSTQLWKNKSIATVLGYTPANAATTLTINGTTYDISANRTWNVGTVTSIGTSGPLTGGTITGSGTIGITQATTSTDGYLSSTDWNTFNSKQAALTFSAPLVNTSGTISIPAASASVNGYLSSTDWVTFNNKQAALNGTGFVKISGTTISYDNSTYYLASNPSAFIALTALSATAPLSYSNTTGVFSISQSTTSTDGYLSSTDWNTFNNKQAAGSYITALTGEATASGPGSASVTLSTSAVTGKLLTGLNLTGGGTIAATDSILQAFGKVQNQISGMVGGVTYQGTWNASTNTPTLTSSVGTKGYYYIVDVAGSTNLNGITDWKIGDWAIFNGSTWDKVDNTDAVSSVNGFTGAVSLTTSNISEGTNLYYLDSRARLALSFTAGSGAYDNTTGVITIPTNTSQLTNGANFITLSSLSASSPLAYNNGTGAFSIQVANGSQNGYLSSTDWTTFNSKQNTITLTTTGSSGSSTLVGATLNVPTYTLSGLGGVPTSRQLTINGTAYDLSADRSWSVGTVTGSGTTGYVSKWSSSTAISNSLLYDNGSAVLLGTATAGSGKFMVYSTTPDNHYQAVGSGPSFRFADTITSPTYTGIVALSTATNQFLTGSVAGDMVLANNTTSSIGNFLFGTGATERMRISPTGNVSINNTNNTYTFDVTGTVRFTGQLRLQSTITDGTNTYTLPSATGTLALTSQIPANPVGGTGTTNYIPKFTGTSAIGNSLVYDDGTNVGIGTTSANTLLSLVGNHAGGQSILKIQSSTAYSSSGLSSIGFNDSDGSRKAIIYTNTNGLQLETGTATPIIFNPNGTTALTLANGGAATFSSSVGANGLFTAQGGVSAAPSTTGTTINGSAVIKPSDGSNAIIMGAYGTSPFGNWIQSQSTSALGTTFPLILQPNGGNVGIGTTSPLQTATNRTVLTINGTSSNVLNFGVGGTLSAYIYSDASDSGLYAQGNLYLQADGAKFTAFVNNGSERMRINSAGNIGIGTTSPVDYTNYRSLHIMGATSTSSAILYLTNSTSSIRGLFFAEGNASRVTIGSQSNHDFTFLTNDTERMRITSDAKILMGTTTYGDVGNSFDNGGGIIVNYSGTGSRVAVEFKNNNGTIGTITCNGSATAYNTSSDYRLKQDLKDFNGLDLVSKLKAYDYEWKSDKTRSYGVIAHELQSVINYAVTGVKDGEQMQGVDYSKIVPVLIKAVQESHTIIKTLEERIINLEHK